MDGIVFLLQKKQFSTQLVYSTHLFTIDPTCSKDTQDNNDFDKICPILTVFHQLRNRQIFLLAMYVYIPYILQ